MHVQRASLWPNGRECFAFKDRGINTVEEQNPGKRQTARASPDDRDTRCSVPGHPLGSFAFIAVVLGQFFDGLLQPCLVPCEASGSKIAGDGLNPSKFSRRLRLKQFDFEPKQAWLKMGPCYPRVQASDLWLEYRDPLLELLERGVRR